MATKRELNNDTVMVSYVELATGRQVRKRFSRARQGAAYKRLADEFYSRVLFEETGLAPSNEHAVLPMKRLTVAEIAERYLNEHLRYTKAWGNRSHVRIFTAKWGKYRLSHLSTAVVRPWLLQLLLEDDRYSASTVKKVTRYAIRMFNWAIEENIIDRNPLDHLVNNTLRKHFARMIQPRETVVAADDFERMQREFPVWLARAVLASWCSGMREGEVCALRKSDIDGRRARIRVTKEVDPKTIILDDRLVQEIVCINAEHEMNDIETDVVFLGAEGEPIVPRNLSKSFRWHCDRLGMRDYWFHDLRRSYIDRKERAGVPLRLISKQVGHHAVETTSTNYRAKISPEELEELADAG
jgi:integrase